MASKKGMKVGDYIVKSKVKEKLQKAGCNSSSCVFDALNGMVGWYLDQAASRAKSNKRKTVRGHDIMVG
jgi:histone H3/H4